MTKSRQRHALPRKLPEWYTRRILTASRPMEYLLSVALLYRQMWVTTLILGVILIRNLTSGRDFGVIEGLLLAFILLPFLLAILSIILVNPDALVNGLAVRGQWDAILLQLPRFERRAARALGADRAKLVIAGWRARCLAKVGRPEEGLEQLMRLKGHPDISEVDRLLMLSQYYDTIENYDEAAESLAQALDLDPENVQAWAGLVEIDAVHRDLPESARLALDTARSLPGYGSLGPGAEYLEGIALATEDRFESAIEHLRRFREWAGTQYQRLPQTIAIDAAAGSMEVASLRALGKLEEADQVLAGIRSRLQRNQALHLMPAFEEIIARHERPAAADLIGS